MTTAATPDVPTSENPFRRAYWTGGIDARIPALFRIALGVILLSDVADHMSDLFTFFTDLGIVPRANVTTPVLRWSLLQLSGRPGPTAALLLLGFPIAFALTVGYRTRAASVLAWVYQMSVMNRNPYICDGGDTLLRLLLLWGAFADLGARFSADCRLGRRAPQATVPALPIRCIQLQIAVVYLVTFLAKNGPGWRDGTAVLHILQNVQWSRGLGPAIARWPGLCKALTWGTLVFEATFAALVLSPIRPRLTRAIALVAGTAFHLGIFLTIRVGLFSLIMPVSYIVFLAPEWIDWAQRRLTGRQPLPPAPTPGAAAAAPGPWARRRRIAGAAALALTFGPAMAGQAVAALGGHVRGPAARWLALFSLEQNWKMFSPDTPVTEVSWTAPGFLTDGQPIDVVDAVAPELRRPSGFTYTRWHKLAHNLAGQPQALLGGIGQYFCRRYNGEHAAPKLERFELALVTASVINRGPPQQVTLLKQQCLQEKGKSQ